MILACPTLQMMKYLHTAEGFRLDPSGRFRSSCRNARRGKVDCTSDRMDRQSRCRNTVRKGKHISTPYMRHSEFITKPSMGLTARSWKERPFGLHGAWVSAESDRLRGGLCGRLSHSQTVRCFVCTLIQEQMFQASSFAIVFLCNCVIYLLLSIAGPNRFGGEYSTHAKGRHF